MTPIPARSVRSSADSRRRALRVVPVVLLAVGVASSALVFACGGGNDNLPPPPPPPPAPMSTDAGAVTTTPSTSTAAAPTPPPGPPATLTPGAPAADPPAPTPTVKITAPTKDQVIPTDKAKDFAVKLDVKNWQTAQGSNHVHLILDNKPYKAIYDTKAPVKLSELTDGGTLEDGFHVLVAFPSRATHESVKTKDALTVVPFWVGKKGDAKADFTKKPMLVYSRPKGNYNGEMANHVLIDFQLANDTLAEGKDHVLVTVSGPGLPKDELSTSVTKFGTPLYLDNLQNGSYTIKLDLVDSMNNPVPGPWNSTTRTIKVDHEAKADMAMPMPAADAGAAPSGADAGAAKGGAKPAGPKK